MALPFSDSSNLGGFRVKPSDIHLITALGSAGSDVSDTFKINNSSVYLVVQGASGQCVVSMKTDSATPISDPASGGDATSVTIINTSKSFIKLDSSSTNVYAAIKIVDSNWSSALAVCDVFVVNSPPSGDDFYWFSTDSMVNGGTVVNSTLPQ